MKSNEVMTALQHYRCSLIISQYPDQRSTGKNDVPRSPIGLRGIFAHSAWAKPNEGYRGRAPEIAKVCGSTPQAMLAILS